jgi:uncharacterized HAD superfamily protein
MKKYNTIFCDIDGTIFKYRQFANYTTEECEVLPGVLNKLNSWKDQGHMIILTTARPEDLRDLTINELNKNKIPYDRIIMGIERGARILINDKDPKLNTPRALGINLQRDQGMVFDTVKLDPESNIF